MIDIEPEVFTVRGEFDRGNQRVSILPYETGAGGSTACIVVNIRIGDPRVEMVDEIRYDIVSADSRGIGRRMDAAVLDGIAVDQRQRVGAGALTT